MIQRHGRGALWLGINLRVNIALESDPRETGVMVVVLLWVMMVKGVVVPSWVRTRGKRERLSGG